MKWSYVIHLSVSLALFLLLVTQGAFSSAAEPQPVAPLTVNAPGAYLYSQQDTESPRLATLQKGEGLTPMAEAVGTQSWYLVRTTQNLIGWVRASDVTASEQTKEAFKKEEIVSVSTWSAQAVDGAKFDGTWTVEPEASTEAASGAWTLQDATGKTVLRGTWSAEKFSTGWNGIWRARGNDQKKEYTGSWSADFPHGPEARLVELFEAAAQAVLRGVWTGGNRSGTWSIRAVQ